MDSFLLLILVTGGSLISSLTGLGGGTLILAGMMLVYPPELAIPLHSFTQLSANGIRTGLFYRSINWKVVGAYAALMIPFAWAGAQLFEHVNSSWLKMIVAIFIIFSILPMKLKPKSEPGLITFTALGALSGFLGVFVGAVGPMVMPFFNRLKIPRDSMLSTKSGGQMFLQVSKILAFWGTAAIDFGPLYNHIAILISGTLVGVLISVPLGKRISDRKFNQLINIMMFFIAMKLLFEGVKEIAGIA